MANKLNYEVALKTYSPYNENAKNDEDYVTQDFCSADNYRDAVRIAKDWSLKIGTTPKQLGYELASVSIICSYADECSEYNIVYDEEYKNGKKLDRFYY